MAKLNFNASSFEHKFKLSMLELYFETFENQLGVIRDQALIRTKARLNSKGIPESDEEYQLSISVVEHHTEDQFPQIFRSQLLIAIWSLIEISINDTANVAKNVYGRELSLNDITGKTPRKKWENYFSHVICRPLAFPEALWKKIDDMRFIRNIVAHTGGVRFQISETNVNRLRDIAGKYEGITVSSVEISFEKQYIENQFCVAREILDILDEVYKTSPLFGS